MTGGNAAKNNAIFTVPAIVFAAISAAWTAYDVYKIYQKEGTKAALKQLGKDGLIALVTDGTGKLAYKVGSKIFKSTSKAWKAYRKTNKSFALLRKTSHFVKAVGNTAKRAKNAVARGVRKFSSRFMSVSDTRFITNVTVKDIKTGQNQDGSEISSYKRWRCVQQ